MSETKTVLSDAAFKDVFKSFFETKGYADKIASIAFLEYPTLRVDYDDIISNLDSQDYDLFQKYPEKSINAMKDAVCELMLDTDVEHENHGNPHNVNVRVENAADTISIRKISLKHNQKLISFNASIAKISEEKPFMIRSVYRCSECSQRTDSEKNQLLKQCPFCDSKTIALDIENCVFTSHRHAIVQDLTEDLPAGQIPVSKPLHIMGHDLTSSEHCRPGSRVKVTAFVKLDYDKTTVDDIRQNQDMLGILDNSTTGITFGLRLVAHNIEQLEEDKTSNSKEIAITPEDIEKFIEFRRKLSENELMSKLVQSFGSHIYGYEVIKEVLLIASVGAHLKHGVKKRGDINILLVGNAGVAKSQLLLSAAAIAPRSIYVSGRGSSGVGLTAAVVRDERTGQMMLEAGATVLADQGQVVIDEFDKLQAADRSALHEVMEQQTCSVAKGGIVATLNARVSVLAAANPINGTYDSYKTLSENTGYPPSMLSRFDYIFATKDKIDAVQDANIATAIIEGIAPDVRPFVDTSTLAKYIRYAKQSADPSISPDAKQRIKEIYVSLRKRSQIDTDGTVSTITITARLVDTLKRASIARAKLLQKDIVEVSDVNRVLWLLSKMFESFGVLVPGSTDTDLQKNVEEMETINLGILFGKPASKQSKHQAFIDVASAISEDGKIDVDIKVLEKELMKTRKFVTEYEARNTIANAIRHNVLSHRQKDLYRYNPEVTK